MAIRRKAIEMSNQAILVLVLRVSESAMMAAPN